MLARKETRAKADAKGAFFFLINSTGDEETADGRVGKQRGLEEVGAWERRGRTAAEGVEYERV